jgi:hypothetical protein
MASNRDSVKSVETLSGQLSNFFSQLTEKFDEAILNNVAKFYGQVMENALPILGAMLFCWLVYWAIQTMYGQIDSKKFARDLGKYIIIIVLISSWDDVYRLIGDPVINGIPELVGAMAGQEQKTLIASFTTMVFDAIYQGFSQIGAGGASEIVFALPLVGVYLVLMV